MFFFFFGETSEFISSREHIGNIFTNVTKQVISEKVVPDFRHRENIHSDREISPPHTHT